MSLRIIITGGTFDKKYDPIAGKLTFENSHLPQIMEQVRVTIPYKLEIKQLLDSLDMVEQNRQGILESCKLSHENHIVITHGTDTMTITAALIGKANIPKTIILTGAMVPYSVQGSDALFNLGAAIMASSLLPPGVYICMNGKTIPWQKAQKNKVLGIFEEKPHDS